MQALPIVADTTVCNKKKVVDLLAFICKNK